MTPDQLRALAETLEHECALRLIAGGKNHEEAQACEQAANYLRACADNQPYETERWNVGRQSDGSLLVCFNRHERGEKCEYEHFVPAPAAPQAEQITRIERRAGGDSSTANMGVQEVMARAEPKRDPHWIDPKFSEWWNSDKADEHADNPFQADSAAAWAYAGWRAAPQATPPRQAGQEISLGALMREQRQSRIVAGAFPDGNPAAKAMIAQTPQTEPCIGNDPACPCQDGDPCHYRDTATTKAWPIPQHLRIEVSLAAGHGYWGVALCVGAQSFALSAEFATLTEADEYAERLRAALGITGDSDAE